jgi:hypothetical protein
MKLVLTLTLLIFQFCLNYQVLYSKDLTSIDSLDKALNSKFSLQDQRISSLVLKIDSVLKSNDSLNSLLTLNEAKLQLINQELGIKIQETEEQAETRITELGGNVEKNRLYWIFASLITLLLGTLMYLFLGKRIKSSQTDVETQIRNTKKYLEEESLKLDGELVKVLQKQLEVLESAPKETTKQDDDHILVIKIADRLTAMETNLYRMDPNTRGLNNLKKLVKSTKENFNAKEYEIVEMLGKEYKEGMEVIATPVPSDEIESGKQIITQVIKPQVNFKGKKIQTAEIVVSVGK